MMGISYKTLFGIALFSLATACTHLPDASSFDGVAHEASCRALISRVDAYIETQEVADAQTARIEGFPYLRVNRFFASFRHELTSRPVFNEWVARLRQLDREARQIELQNLGAANIITMIDTCAQRLLAEDQARPAFKEALIAAARPPRHYDDLARGIGIYPLTQIGVALGFERWKAENLTTFKAGNEPLSDQSMQYGLAPSTPMTPDAIAALIDLSSQNALGVPDIEGTLFTDLARQFAPVISVEKIGEVEANADRIGRPFWPSIDTVSPQVDTADPTIYVRLAHTRFAGQVLAQLVYTIWFPARPLEGPFDLLGGNLDGLVWRVTLGRDGKPLIYDSFHACGCYHLFFPVPPLMREDVAADHDLREAPLVPRAAPVLAPSEKLVLHVRSGSHYLSALSVRDDPSFDVPLRLVNEMNGPAYGLRSLLLADGMRRSLFDVDGIVPGTERLERFILWPMGIANAGAMRQWGTHATAFVGERHADDPFLFEDTFAQ